MNEHVQERFGRSRRGVQANYQPQQAKVLILPQKLNTRIREYYQTPQPPAECGNWARRPEFPTADEVLDLDTGGSSSSDSTGSVIIPTNKVKGAFDGTEHYLSTHYELLREDAIRGLREAVGKVRYTPQATEDTFQSQVGIYDKVRSCIASITPA